MEISTDPKKPDYLSEDHQQELVNKVRQKTLKRNQTASNSLEHNQDKVVASIEEKFCDTCERIQRGLQSYTDVSEKILQLQYYLPILQEKSSKNQKSTDDFQRYVNVLLISLRTLYYELILTRNRLNRFIQETAKNRPTGVITWKISGFSEKQRDCQSERITSIYSPDFYSSEFGHRFCIRFYLHGDGSVRENFISIFIVLLRGPYDAILEWPMKNRVIICLYDQRTIIEGDPTKKPKHIIQSFIPHTESKSFHRPKYEMNTATGIPKFAETALFEDLQRCPYVVDDTLYLKVLVDFYDLPRDLFNFVFDLDPSLPAAVQEQMILAEKAKFLA